MSIKSKLTELRNKLLTKKSIMQDEKAEMAGLLKAAIIAVVALVVIVTLGTAVLPGAITTLSNTSAITGYSTWSSGTQSVWTALAVFVVLVFLLILVAILLAVLG